ncbi:CidA/LrgA family protein [Paenibacillus tyrfis]|uniref:CidA/LrgA family protein n=1 Tax=Paenibacillus TaxID=44249 RepID=UPI002492D2E7|nr:CidA/LrgA family protein [Paenibacillus tyrfis]GLI05490.1 CidA/LrgA family protein [Paenibacillus tyrfis]GMX64340.1 CidA/LrgA family protein [Paenibacillus elgii]
MRGFAILLGFYLLGTILQLGLKLPLPANVIGLILFTASLFLKWVKVEWVEEAGSFLIKHMLLLFAPIVVGTMVFFSWIGEQAVTILVSLFASTFGVLLVTGWTAKLLGGGRARKEGNRRHDIP